MENSTTKQPAESTDISLSQAVLAPLDAIFKAQIHAARSYINMLWQMAYPHLPVDSKGDQVKFKKAYDDNGTTVLQDLDDSYFIMDENDNKAPKPDFNPGDSKPLDLHLPYPFPITFKTNSNNVEKQYVMDIPAIAMIPTTPLGIEEANIKFSMSVSKIDEHQQMQDNTNKKFSQNNNDGYSSTKRPWYLVKEPKSILGNMKSSDSSSSAIDITIKLTKSPIPAALEKSLTVLTQSISVSER